MLSAYRHSQDSEDSDSVDLRPSENNSGIPCDYELDYLLGKDMLGLEMLCICVILRAPSYGIPIPALASMMKEDHLSAFVKVVLGPS